MKEPKFKIGDKIVVFDLYGAAVKEIKGVLVSETSVKYTYVDPSFFTIDSSNLLTESEVEEARSKKALKSAIELLNKHKTEVEQLFDELYAGDSNDKA